MLVAGAEVERLTHGRRTTRLWRQTLCSFISYPSCFRTYHRQATCPRARPPTAWRLWCVFISAVLRHGLRSINVRPVDALNERALPHFTGPTAVHQVQWSLKWDLSPVHFHLPLFLRTIFAVIINLTLLSLFPDMAPSTDSSTPFSIDDGSPAAEQTPSNRKRHLRAAQVMPPPSLPAQ